MSWVGECCTFGIGLDKVKLLVVLFTPIGKFFSVILLSNSTFCLPISFPPISVPTILCPISGNSPKALESFNFPSQF